MKIELVEVKKDAAGRDHSTYSVNGEGQYGKSDLCNRVVEFLLSEFLQKFSLEESIKKVNEGGKCKDRPLVVTDISDKKYSRYKPAVFEVNGNKYTVYSDNGWHVETVELFIENCNKNFANIPNDEYSVSVVGQKKVETLMKEFNEKFPYLQLCIFPKSMMSSSTKTPVDRSLTIAQARANDIVNGKDFSIHGLRLVKNIEKDFLDNYGLYVEICYYNKEGKGFYTSGSYDEMNLTALNREIESLGGVKDKWY